MEIEALIEIEKLKQFISILDMHIEKPTNN